ncbi:hypothetical protein BBP40_009545 [Aspergillus hancockii]|nr:hypothetical protein BBP40_009545 [Aspergillus hancockii]
MLLALSPPPAFLPLRNGTVSFSGDEPPILDRDRVLSPPDPTSGRANNQGLEGLALSPDGRFLYAMMQSATNQEGGPKKRFRRQARLLECDINDKQFPVLSREYVISLPLYDTGNQMEAVGQSEIHRLSNGQLLILARDSGFGRGKKQSQSKYRHVDIISIDEGSNIAHGYSDLINGSIASTKGVLIPNITAATYCPFLDVNLNSELIKFGLHNGGKQDRFLLNEKWESLALVPLN